MTNLSATSKTIKACMGEIPFTLAIKNIRLVNILTREIYPADIGIQGNEFAYVGLFDDKHKAEHTIDGENRYAIPGLIDSHMHIESSMMTPAAFAAAILPMGTTTVAADPHEIGNVLGVAGVKMLADSARGLPLHVHIMAPSTIPSAPGFETSGADIGGPEVAEMLRIPGVLGLGEVMDFLGVIAADPKMMAVIDAAKQAGVLLDGHVPTLRGKELQAFAAAGPDADHTYMSPEIVQEKLRCGICVQIQERFLTPELMRYLNECPVQNRIMLATDDVPITRLATQGHLSGVLRKAIALGLDPVKAVRYATINAADRLRLVRQGAISPGRRADLALLDSLEEMRVHSVFSDGVLVAENGKILVAIEKKSFPEEAYHTMVMSKAITAQDFEIRCGGSQAVVNVIEQDGKTSRTVRTQAVCAAEGGLLRQGDLMKMAVFERHTGKGERALGLIGNMEGFEGAMATSYAHDCHNLVVYSANDTDAVLAANRVIEMGGGVAAVREGKFLCAIPLPIAGILCEDSMEELAKKFEALEAAAKEMHLNHEEPLTFLTLMPLAVSPEIKLTDKGLLDVVRKEFLPLIEEREPS